MRKTHSTSFYVLDTESSGFREHGGYNEPIQIVAVLYKDGKEAKRKPYSRYFLPNTPITDSAYKTHRLDVKKLKELGAQRITRADIDILVNFLNEEPDYPIVAHWAKYDREDVLKPVFEYFDKEDKFPSISRWACTIELAK